MNRCVQRCEWCRVRCSRKWRRAIGVTNSRLIALQTRNSCSRDCSSSPAADSHRKWMSLIYTMKLYRWKIFQLNHRETSLGITIKTLAGKLVGGYAAELRLSLKYLNSDLEGTWKWDFVSTSTKFNIKIYIAKLTFLRRWTLRNRSWRSHGF